MREISVREANQNFSQVIAAAERGETSSSPRTADPSPRSRRNRKTAPATPNGGPASRRSRKACDRSAGQVAASAPSRRTTNTATTRRDPHRDRQQYPHLLRNRARFGKKGNAIRRPDPADCA